MPVVDQCMHIQTDNDDHRDDDDELLSQTSFSGTKEQTFGDELTESHLDVPHSPSQSPQSLAEQSHVKGCVETTNDGANDEGVNDDRDDDESQHDEDEDDIAGSADVVLQRHGNAGAGSAAISTESLNGGTINDDHDDNAKHDHEHALTSMIER